MLIFQEPKRFFLGLSALKFCFEFTPTTAPIALKTQQSKALPNAPALAFIFNISVPVKNIAAYTQNPQIIPLNIPFSRLFFPQKNPAAKQPAHSDNDDIADFTTSFPSTMVSKNEKPNRHNVTTPIPNNIGSAVFENRESDICLMIEFLRIKSLLSIKKIVPVHFAVLRAQYILLQKP